MNSPISARRVSSSSQTYYRQNKVNYSKDLNLKDKVQIYSFQVPFGKISLSKKIPAKKIDKKALVYPGILKKNSDCLKDKLKYRANQVYVNFPDIKRPNLKKGCYSGDFRSGARKVKIKNFSEDYGELLFREPNKRDNARGENYAMHKTFFDVIEDLKTRQKVKKIEDFDFYY